MAKDVDNLISEIVEFFAKKKNYLKENLDKNENNLLESLRFLECCNLDKSKRSKNALFGYKTLKPDYHPKDNKNIIIEVKYIRIKQNKKGNQYNECDIKNALSQIIEQAVCKKSKKCNPCYYRCWQS